MIPEALQHLAHRDRVMGRLIQRVGPCTLKPANRRNPFEALVRSVAYQQLHASAAAAILRRIKALYAGKRFPGPADILATSDERLRATGLSRAKVAAIRDSAANTIEGVVPNSRAISKMSDDELLQRLTTVRGVGPWTVEMLLIFTLGRPDVLPATDYGVRRGFAMTYGWPELPRPRDLLEHGQRWRPHRTTATWYLWRAAELPAGR